MRPVAFGAVQSQRTPLPGLIDTDSKLGRVTWQTRKAAIVLAAQFHAQTRMYLRVRSGRRTCAEQNAIYAKGRTTYLGSKPETYAQGCQSWHVLGRAIDFDVVRNPDGSDKTDLCETYALMGQMWEGLTGGTWGGRFRGFGPCGDAGHVENTKGVSHSALCPDPTACATIDALVDADIADPKVPAWPYALGAFLVVGAAALVLSARK